MSADRTEWIEVEAHGCITVLHLSGANGTNSDSEQSSRRYRVGMADLFRIADENSPHILLNFYGLQNLQGPDLTPFMRLAMRVRQRNGRIAACHLPEGVQTIFEVARLDRVVAVYADQDQAICGLLLPACA